MATSVRFTSTRGTVLMGEELRSCYSGPTNEAGRRSGEGVYAYPNRFFEYRGDFKNGKKHGIGRLQIGPDAYYEGEFEAGEMNGQGFRRYANGSTYEGTHSAGEPSGRGCFRSHLGWTYTGDMQDGQCSGEGVLHCADGACCKGTFSQAMLHGIGSIERSDGSKYTGAWQHGKQHGKGLETTLDGDTYKADLQGDFVEGLRSGEGQLCCRASGIQYSGSFAQNQPCPTPGALSLTYPQTIDKKKGALPPELRRGALCSLLISISVQAKQIGTTGDGGAAEALVSRPPDEEGGDLGNPGVCTNESSRPITLRVFQGWPDADDTRGSRVERPCLHMARVAPEPAAAGPSAACAAPQGDMAAGPSALGKAAEARGEAPPEDGEALVVVRTLHGVCKIEELRFGVLDGEAELPAGQYTLAFCSPGLEDACMPFVAL